MSKYDIRDYIRYTYDLHIYQELALLLNTEFRFYV